MNNCMNTHHLYLPFFPNIGFHGLVSLFNGMSRFVGYLIVIQLRNDFFYFNHFSLIIFYHSVWLGFELFGIRIQVCSQLVQLTLRCKGYDNHHCHNKPQTGNAAGVGMTSCPEDILELWLREVYNVNPNPSSKKNSSCTLQRIAGRIRGSYFSQRYLSESERNSSSRFRTCLLRFRTHRFNHYPQEHPLALM